MEYQKDAAITDAGKDIACSCIRGEELREHMREHLYEPEAIIAGSLESLDKKQAMLERLREEAPQDRIEEIDSYLAQLTSALDALRNVERDRGILLVSAMFYSDEDRGPDTFDGPFPVASWDAAQSLMAHYADDRLDDDWPESYWKIDLHTSEDLHQHQTDQPSLSFAATKDGELIFLNDRREHRTRRPTVESVWRNKCRRFCANNEPFYTPWAPGDIIKIDGRPFDHGPRFAIVLEDDYERTFRGQVWCACPSEDYGVKEGSLSTGTYQDGIPNAFTPSALYTAERYTGDLPDDCTFMLELSKKLRDDPAYGKHWSEGSVGHDCLQPYRKPAGPKAEAIRAGILEFIDSPSIKEHLESVDFEFTAPAAAFIVNRSNRATIRQKLAGWQKILDNMPNCSMSRRNDSWNIPDFHAFLRSVIKQEHRRLSHFKKPDGNHLYFFEDYSKGPRTNALSFGPYSTYDKCFDAIWKEFEDKTPSRIKISRLPLDPDEEDSRESTIVLNAKGEVMRCDHYLDDQDERGSELDFEYMWFDIPTPFHAGDIVCNLHTPDEPFVLLDLQTWGSERVKKELPPSVYRDRQVRKADDLLKWHRYDGDASDMYAYGCQMEYPPEYPIYIGEPAAFLLDLDYYRKPLKPEEKILYGVRAFTKGDLGIDSLVALAGLCELQAQARKRAERFEMEDGWLKNQYPELFDIVAKVPTDDSLKSAPVAETPSTDASLEDAAPQSKE